MKSLVLTIALLAGAVLGARAAFAAEPPTTLPAPAPVEFAGHIVLGGDEYFVLYAPDAKLTSAWLRLRQGWRGWTLKSFDPKTERLTLTTGFAERVLALRTSRVEPVFSPSLTRGASMLQNGTLVYSADAALLLGNGIVVTSPNGTMISDVERQTIGGDLEITLPNGTAAVENGALTVKGGKMVLTGDTFRLRLQPAASGAAKEKPGR